MSVPNQNSKEIFSLHLAKLPIWLVPCFLFSPFREQKIPGLRHAESFFVMNLGAPILSPSRYNLKKVALFAWWSEEKCLDEFLREPSRKFFREGWHMRMRLYRKWGEISELRGVAADPTLANPGQPVVAVTLARLKLLQALRFIKWGRPVESQVRDHLGQTMALAAIRPFTTFSTFSVWKNESEMLGMVQGKNRFQDGESHKLAMQERSRKDFHREFSTMRFVPFRES